MFTYTGRGFVEFYLFNEEHGGVEQLIKAFTLCFK
jgi:hypothetical protein